MLVAEWQSLRRTVAMTHGDGSYVELGAGPPVLLLHGVGFAQGAHDWFLNIEALAQRFRVFALDLVGWGRGARLGQGYAFARLVDYVREFQDELGIRTSHVVGHSMGGWVASLLGYESPQRVDRLVLVGSGGVATRPLPMMTSFEPPPLDEIVAALSARSSLREAELRPWAEYAWQNVQDSAAADSYRRVLAHMTDPETRSLYNMVRRLPHLAAETLVVWGEQDSVNDIALGRKTCELIPDASLSILPCGHFPATELPLEFNQLIRSFLSGGLTAVRG